MIEVLFSRLNKLTSRLNIIATHTAQTAFGDGALGNWYVCTSNPTGLPATYQIKNTTLSSNYMPMLPSYNFKNLVIDTGATLSFRGDIAVIRVQDTLTLKGTISMAETHLGDTYQTIGSMCNPSNVQMSGEIAVLPDQGKFITGSYQSGGYCIVYYNLLQDQYNVNLGTNFGSSVNIKGGTDTTRIAGGYLCILAKTIILYPTGKLDVHGSDGSGASGSVSGHFLNYRLREIEIN